MIRQFYWTDWWDPNRYYYFGHSGNGSNCNLHSSKLQVWSLTIKCLVLYPGYSMCRGYFSTEIHLEYSKAPADCLNHFLNWSIWYIDKTKKITTILGRYSYFSFKISYLFIQTLQYGQKVTHSQIFREI